MRRCRCIPDSAFSRSVIRNWLRIVKRRNPRRKALPPSPPPRLRFVKPPNRPPRPAIPARQSAQKCPEASPAPAAQAPKYKRCCGNGTVNSAPGRAAWRFSPGEVPAPDYREATPAAIGVDRERLNGEPVLKLFYPALRSVIAMSETIRHWRDAMNEFQLLWSVTDSDRAESAGAPCSESGARHKRRRPPRSRGHRMH